jgi:hypothetical protein
MECVNGKFSEEKERFLCENKNKDVKQLMQGQWINRGNHLGHLNEAGKGWQTWKCIWKGREQHRKLCHRTTSPLWNSSK